MKKAAAAAIFFFAAPVLFAGSWATNPLWDDGKAEVAVYQTKRIVYKTVRNFYEQLITVKDDFHVDSLVKADDPDHQKTIRVLKLNDVQKFPTENYPYSYLTSVFLAEFPFEPPVKLTVGSQEWCGNTFKILKRDANRASFEWHSYFDGEADATLSLAIKPGDLFEDQLPLSLRALPFAEGYREDIRLWDSLMTSHGTVPKPQKAAVVVQGKETVSCRAGSIPCWKVAVQKGSGEDTYWLERAFPNILVRMKAADGRTRILYGRARWRYWDRSVRMPKALITPTQPGGNER